MKEMNKQLGKFDSSSANSQALVQCLQHLVGQQLSSIKIRLFQFELDILNGDNPQRFLHYNIAPSAVLELLQTRPLACGEYASLTVTLQDR